MRRWRTARRAVWVGLALLGCATPGLRPAPDPEVEPYHQRLPIPREEKSMTGFGDFHAHMFSEKSFGQLLFHGDAYWHGSQDPKVQVENALRDCDHAKFPHVLNAFAIPQFEKGHRSFGYPRFKTWPSHDTWFHQQMYIDWVHRAYRSGLRLLVITITNAETLCKISNKKRGAPCNDMEVVDAQLDAIHAMLSAIRTYERSWMELAESPSRAREIVEDNRLAVVIGIEVDTLFDCGEIGDPECLEASYGERLDELYRRGVRQINPVHLIDNGFAGAAMYDERFNLNQLFLRGTTMEPRPVCQDEAVDYEFQGAKGVPIELRAVPLLWRHRRYDPDYEPRPVGQEGHCNRRGLSRPGKVLVRELMGRGILIDIDHMSEESIQRTAEIAREACTRGPGVCFPLIAAHSWFRDLKGRLPPGSGVYQDRVVDLEEALELTTEMQKSSDSLAIVRELGGVVGLITNQGRVRDAGGPVGNDCDTSSKSVAQALRYAVEAMQGQGGVGFGTDFNGLPGQPSPRFGSDACGAKKAEASFTTRVRQVQRLPYPFTDHFGQQIRANQTGERVFDFNEDGLAHYGLLPDMIADFENLGAARGDIDTLFRSAEAYIEMWERAEIAKDAY